MMSREGFALWLLTEPTNGEVIEHLEYLRYWATQLKDGGNGYVSDIHKMGHDYILRPKDPGTA